MSARLHRRLLLNLRARDWGAVVIDIAILVIGVFLGLQADTWNDARKAAAEGRYYTQRLRDELAESIERLDAAIAGGRATVEASRRAQRAIREGSIAPDEPEAFVADFLAVMRMEEADVVDGAIEELRSTGRMGVIRNRQVREAVSRYYRALQSARGQEQVSNQGWIAALADIYREVDASLEPEQQLLLAIDVSDLNGNERVARALFTATVYHYAQILALERLREETRALQGLVEKAID